VTSVPYTDVSLALPRRFTPITDIEVVVSERCLGKPVVVHVPPGFERLEGDLNQDRGNAPHISLCVRRDAAIAPITDIVVLCKGSEANAAEPTVPDNYIKLNVNVNQGGNAGDRVWLAYTRDSTGSPITDIAIVTERDPVPSGFRLRGACCALGAVGVCHHAALNVSLSPPDQNLNRGSGGAVVYLAVCQNMPIRQVQLKPHGMPGFKYIEQNLFLSALWSPLLRPLARFSLVDWLRFRWRRA
jgi:hypothetical protein